MIFKINTLAPSSSSWSMNWILNSCWIRHKNWSGSSGDLCGSLSWHWTLSQSWNWGGR
jgi:hypothetical protein